ncbi:hypothetical protein Pcaca03_09510 [Pectobacterium carotovorum subsp. carotovorum]|uniref:Uncharacterized protein n=1 Tax=Pectobacterium carotovorum subsp. carotovorum TaxID=555 RepID=A0AAI9PD35_PECCC|nr:hypothetical protein SOASR016_39490 [Pectobacterium carotovorum subsp. carotovorum]GLV68507.1 hypothetical protein Pcaca03_09510 [Pectobacterium carotovorum subsp. carotovorum]
MQINAVLKQAVPCALTVYAVANMDIAGVDQVIAEKDVSLASVMMIKIKLTLLSVELRVRQQVRVFVLGLLYLVPLVQWLALVQ